MAQADQLRRVLTRQPFRPFKLRMVDGTLYEVPHPDWLSVPPAALRPREVAYYLKPASVPTDEEVESYEVHWLDLSLISEVIELKVSAARAEGNGA
jgi:hypothetical protein